MQTEKHTGISLAFYGLTAASAAALLAVHTPTTAVTKGGRKKPEATTEEKDEIDVAEMSRGKDGKKRKPKAKFASNAAEEQEEEENDDGDESEEEEETTDSDDADEEEESEESEEESDSEDEQEEEPAVSFAQVKAAIDKYGDKKPKTMKTLLSSFNLKSTAELKKNKKKWAPVLRKIKATFAK